MRALARLLPLLKGFTGEVLLSLLLGVAAIAAGIGLLGTSAYLIASAALRPSIAELQVAIVGVRFFGISRGVFRYFERLFSHSVNLRFLTCLRDDFYRRVEPGAPSNLMTFRSGDLLEGVMGDHETLQNFYVRVIAPAVVALVIIIGVSFFVGGYALQLGLILALGLVSGGFIHPLFSMLLSKHHLQRLASSRAAVSARMVEVLQGLEDIQVCNAQQSYFGSLLDEFEKTGAAQKRLTNISAGSSGLSLLITNLTVLGLLWAAIPLIGTGDFSGISLAVVTLVALASFEAILPMPSAALHLNASAIAASRLNSIGSEADEKHESSYSGVPSPSPLLRFDDVSFAYEPETAPLLMNIDFVLQRGRKVALVGASGVGKTSLVNLLLGFTQPLAGKITCAGMDPRYTDPERYRSQIAVLQQSAYLFNDTLRGNLLLAKAEAQDAEIIRVLNEVELADWFSSLPEGLDTWIGEHGMKMSGGERQRLAIARVLLQEKPLIVLDEPTANLDQLTARRVMKTLFNRAADSGVLLITYDVGLLSLVDEILVISGGKITQRGTLQSLQKQEGDFRRFFALESDRLNEL